ncbi:MAG: protein-L-isoaspartate(D-aspartate) O-methyltransferase [Gemmatimonadetes bacterium]|nr:protein-L-isoaspartate(D-aspartate) O-methyltransferase [Gemmatimonadota bacterium]
MIDSHRALERAHMVQAQLRRRGVEDSRVLDVMGRVPRERFVPPEFSSRAYADHALSIGHHQTISQPYMVAVMTAALGLNGWEKVLEVGTGSGYQCAILAELAREVFTIERIPELARSAEELLVYELGYSNVHVHAGDGTLGWPEAAPFDAIIVTAAAPGAPPALLDQMDADGGHMIVPVGSQSLQQIEHIRRQGTAFSREKSTPCRFVPLVGLQGWPDDDA